MNYLKRSDNTWKTQQYVKTVLGSSKNNYEESNMYLKSKIIITTNDSSTGELNEVIFTSSFTNYKENIIDILFLIILISCIIVVIKI